MISTTKAALGAATLALVLALAAGAQAKPLPDEGMTLQEVAAWLQAGGYKAETKLDKDGNYIFTAAEGINITVYLSDCKNDRCKSLDFRAWWGFKGKFQSDNTAALEKINEWNKTKRWAKAYLDKDRDPNVEMNVSTSPGVTSEGLDDDFNTFTTMALAFQKFIGV